MYDTSNDTGLHIDSAPAEPRGVIISTGGNVFETNEPATTTSDNAFRPDNLYTDLKDATMTTVNELRKKFTEQQIKEIDALHGTRYNEYLNGHWGVKADMSKINKSTFLGGTHETIEIHQIPQTSATKTTGSDTPLANLGALGQTKINGNTIKKSFDQHGYLITLATIRYNHTYQDGIEIEDLYQNKEDFFDPVNNNIGNQPIFNKEINYLNDSTDNEIFG